MRLKPLKSHGDSDSDEEFTAIVRHNLDVLHTAQSTVVSPHHMHNADAASTVADGVAWYVCLSVCVGHDRQPIKTAEPTEMPFWVKSTGPKESRAGRK